MRPCVLLTRAEGDNARLAAQLEALGIASHGLPLLAIEPLPEDSGQRNLILNLDRYQAVMVVSPVAARYGLERLDQYWPQPPAGQHWFAVGETTASVLRAYGLPVHIPEEGQDSEALLRLPIWQELIESPDLAVLIWRGVGGREHLADHVRAAGGRVDYLELYRRLPPAGLGEALAAAAGQGVRSIVISSGQALRHWQAASGAHWSQWRHWRCWVPSERVAELARQFGCDDVVTCHGADDRSVLTAIMADPPTA